MSNERTFSRDLNELAEEFTKPIVDELRKAIKNIKDYYQISNEDIGKLLDIDEITMQAIVDGNPESDVLLDLRVISLLTLLSNGTLHVLCDSPSGKQINDVNKIIKDYQDYQDYLNKPIDKKDEKSDWNEKVKQIFDLLGVKNLDDLDCMLNSVKNICSSINMEENHDGKCDKNKCKCNTNERKPIYVDSKGNFHSQENYTAKKDENVVKGSYFNSDSMDKPEEFEFMGNLDELIPNLLEFIGKSLS
jgi:hypothetical protein